MAVYDVSSNRSLYKTFEGLTEGQISRLGDDYEFSSGGKRAPLLISKHIASDGERFLRIKLLSRVANNGQGLTYQPLTTLDIDRRLHLAWIVANEKSPFTTPREGVKSKREEALWFLAKNLSPTLTQLQAADDAEQKGLRQQAVARKRARSRQLAEDFNLPPGHSKRVKATKRKIRDERKAQLREDASNGKQDPPDYLKDILHRKALYQRLTSTFGDLEAVRDGIVLDGEQTGNPYARDLLFVQSRRVENRGLFELYTTSQGSSESRTLVAMFLVDFVAMQAQATPALELLKGAYTLALRAPEHLKQVNLDSQLGALLPRGIKDPVAREEAYGAMLPYAGVSGERFSRIPSRVISSSNRLGLFCNLATDGMLQQAQRAGYARPDQEFNKLQERSQPFRFENVRRDASSEAVTVKFEDGSEETLMVTGVGKGRSTREVLGEYVRQQLEKQASHQVGQNGSRSHGLRHSY
jgi:hypothetical protein